MATFNGISITFDYVDEVDDVIARWAAGVDSSPQYLAWQPSAPQTLKDLLDPGATYLIENVLELVLESEELQFPDNLPVLPQVERAELERIFIATHTLRDDPQFELLIKTSGNLRDEDFDSAQRTADVTRRRLTQTLTTTRQRAAASIRRIKTFTRYPVVSYTPLTAVKEIYTLALGACRLTALELLDVITPNVSTPYASADQFAKYLKGFVPTLKWRDLTTGGSALLLKIDAEKRGLKPLKDPYRRYSSAVFAVQPDENVLYATFELWVGKRFVAREEFTARALSVFTAADVLQPIILQTPSTVLVQNAVQIGYVAQTAIPGVTIQMPVLNDVILTHQLISRAAAIDESTRAFRLKPSAYVHVADTGQAVSVQERKTERQNQFNDDSPEQTPYLYLRIKAVNHEHAVRIADLIARIVETTRTVTDETVQFYAAYDRGQGFASRWLAARGAKTTETVEKPRKKLTLKDVAPEIFVPTYSRKCLHAPSLVDDEEGEALMQRGEPVMKFPIFGESQARYYVCHHPHHPFPGLRENVLSNKQQFPLVPCCYSKDQRQNPDSKWYAYYRRSTAEDTTVDSAGDSALMSAATAAPIESPSSLSSPSATWRPEHSRVESIPEPLDALLKFLYDKPSAKFVRLIAKYEDESSAVEAVILATQRRVAQPNEAVRDRRVMASRPNQYVTGCLQELVAYAKRDFNEDESLKGQATLQKWIQTRWNLYLADGTRWLDALQYFRALELYFDCNVYIFDLKGPLIPDVETGHYRYAPSRQTILLFYNTANNRLRYEPLMVITHDTGRGAVEGGLTGFSPTDPFVTRLHHFFASMEQTFVDGVPLPTLRLNALPVESQIVDATGRARLLLLTFNAKTITLVVDPLPPLPVPLTPAGVNLPRCKFNDVKETLGTRFLGGDVKISVDGTRAREWTGILDNRVACSILIDDDRPSSAYEITSYDVSDVEKVTIFARAEKTARLLIEYAKKLFVDRFKAGELAGAANHLPTVEDVAAFAGVGLVVTGADVDYVSGPRFIIPGSYVDARRRLIVADDETARRIMYTLSLAVTNDAEKLLTDYNSSVILIPGYYRLPGDFRTAAEYVVMRYETNWTETTDEDEDFRRSRRAPKPKPSMTRASTWPLKTDEAYFLKPTGVNRVYLARNCATLKLAVKTAAFWEAFGYYGTREDLETKSYDVSGIRLYAWTRNKTVTRLMIESDGTLRLDSRFKLVPDVSAAVAYGDPPDDPIGYVALMRL